MKSLLALSILVLGAVAQAKPCQKTNSPKELDACFQSPGLKWAFPVPSGLNAEMIRKGPEVKPQLTEAELASSTVFCQYFFHQFDSPGSAKFLCARTTPEGVLLDKKGKPVKDARKVSTREMNLQIVLKQADGSEKQVSVGEAVLLDGSGRPLIKTKENGEQELIEADELKVKYFVNPDQFTEDSVRRETHHLSFAGQTVSIPNAFVGPTDIAVPRWNEVFTETASTRIFWALGLPADVMIPIQKLVCFGCESHPKDQKELNLSRTSVYNTVVIERKLKGSKVGEQFNFNRVLGRHFPSWRAETRHEFEALALGAQLIGYHNFISLQNRMQCLDGKMDKETKVCSEPVAMIQDVGSTFGGDDGRGIFSLFKKTKMFSDSRTCTLFYQVGSSRFKEVFDGQPLTQVSAEGLEKFKARLANLTPDILREIFQTARFGDMEPGLRDSMPGSTLEEKRKAVVELWVQVVSAKIEEARRATCN